MGTPNHGGTVTITNNGTGLNYSPSANFQGTETMTYTISDGLGHTAIGTVTATVTNTNDPPTAVNDTLTGFKNTGISFDVLANDTSAPDPAENLLIDSITQPANGTLTITENGKKVSFVPTNNQPGTTSFTYVIRDPSGSVSNSATATINVQEFVPSTLSGFAYFDVDNDGVKDAGELPIAGITITLTGTTTSTTTVNVTTKTKDDGSYKFETGARHLHDQGDAAGIYDRRQRYCRFARRIGQHEESSRRHEHGPGHDGSQQQLRRAGAGGIDDVDSRLVLVHLAELCSYCPRYGWHATLAFDEQPRLDWILRRHVSLQNNNQLKFQTTNPQAQTVSTTVNLPSTKVHLLGQTGGNSLYRLNDGPAGFTFTPTTTPNNQAPTAVNDSFTATVSTPRTVAAAGVLANDTDPESNALTASLVGQARTAPFRSGPTVRSRTRRAAHLPGPIASPIAPTMPRPAAALRRLPSRWRQPARLRPALAIRSWSPKILPRTVTSPGILSNDTGVGTVTLTATA